MVLYPNKLPESERVCSGICTYVKVPPKSRMGQAISYAYPLWPRMKAFLKDGNIKIDNNLAENAIRPLTLSRKNFLFCGNHEAAENTAVICSLLATCKAQEVNPREWLNDVIARLPYYQEKDSGKDIRKHSKKCTFYTLRFGCSFAAVNTIKPQLL